MAAIKRIFRAFLYWLTLGVAASLPRGRRQCFRLTILKLDRLGDAVLSLGAVRQLTQHFGESQTLLIVSPLAAPLFRREFPEATLMVLPPFCDAYWPDLVRILHRHGRRLREIETETLVCLRHQASDYLHVIASLLNPQRCHASRWILGWESISLSFPRATHVKYPDTGNSVCLELEAHRRVTESAVGKSVSTADITPDIKSVQPEIGQSLLVCPMTGETIRQYPPASLAQALQIILTSVPLPLHFCLPPGTDRQPWTQALDQLGLTCEVWHQPESIEDLLLVIAGAHAVLAPDSAPAHLATALDKPGVFLVGGGHFGMFAPWSKSARQIWLNHPLECYQCRWHCRFPEPYCMTHITPQDVAQAVLQVLRQTGPEILHC